jgi:hypothetical protein
LNEFAPPRQLNRYVASCSHTMRTLRTLSILVLAFGVLYFAAAMFSLYHYRSVLRLFAQYGVPDEVQLSVPDIAHTRAQLFGAFIEFLIIGLVVSFVGIALGRAWRWSRRAWLWVVTLLLFFHAARLVFDFRLGSLIAFERIAELFLIGMIAVVSWRWLMRDTVIAAFRGNAAAT